MSVCRERVRRTGWGTFREQPGAREVDSYTGEAYASCTITIRGISIMSADTIDVELIDDETMREHKKAVLDRLRRVEGQVRGLQRMVEEGKPCADTITQVSAVMGAMKRIAAVMVACSMRQAIQCAAADSRDPEKDLDKLMDAFAKMA